MTTITFHVVRLLGKWAVVRAATGAVIATHRRHVHAIDHADTRNRAATPARQWRASA